MAVAIVGTPGSAQQTGSPNNSSATVASGATLLIVATLIRGTATITAQTFNGTALNSDASLRFTSSSLAVEIRWLENPSITTANIATTLSAGNAHGVYWWALSGGNASATLANVFGTIATVGSGTTGNQSAPSLAVTNIDAGAAVIAAIVHEGAAAMTGNGANQVRIGNDHGQWNSAASYELFASSSASDTQSFTNAASDTYAMIAVEVRPGAQSKTLTNASETEAAQTLVVRKTIFKTITHAAETTTAMQVSTGPQEITLTPAAETETAQALNIDKYVDITPVAETTTAASAVLESTAIGVKSRGGR